MISQKNFGKRTVMNQSYRLRDAQHVLHGWTLALVVSAPAVYAAPAATELPGGGQVSAGQASIAVDGAHMDVNQTSQNASLNWQTFNVGRNAEVEFHQPNASSVAVNRIADP
ncbi:MAG: hypothetical protein EPN21_03635, partial [Methylococcaceae bacterium]